MAQLWILIGDFLKISFKIKFTDFTTVLSSNNQLYVI